MKKVLKIFLGVLAGVAMLVQLPQVVDWFSPNDNSGRPMSYKYGGLAGEIVLGAFCIALIGDANKS